MRGEKEKNEIATNVNQPNSLAMHTTLFYLFIYLFKIWTVKMDQSQGATLHISKIEPKNSVLSTLHLPIATKYYSLRRPQKKNPHHHHHIKLLPLDTQSINQTNK